MLTHVSRAPDLCVRVCPPAAVCVGGNMFAVYIAGVYILCTCMCLYRVCMCSYIPICIYRIYLYIYIIIWIDIYVYSYIYTNTPYTYAHTLIQRSVPRGFKGIYTQLQASARQEAICGRCNLQELAAELSARV